MEKDTEYDIINGIELFDFIYKFDSKNENLDKYNVSFNKNIDDDNYESYISYFDMDGYIDNIKKSYSYREDKIYNQFNVDYYRQNIKLNGYKYDKELFIKKLDDFLLNTSPNNIFNMSWRSFIVLLCCQSSFTLPYLILQKKYVKSSDKVLVSGGQGSININIDINTDKVIIELSSICNLKETDSGIKTEKIKSAVTIDLDKIREDNLYDPLICIFSWKIYPM